MSEDVPDEIDEEIIVCQGCGEVLADCICNVEDELTEDDDIPDEF